MNQDESDIHLRPFFIMLRHTMHRECTSIILM